MVACARAFACIRLIGSKFNVSLAVESCRVRLKVFQTCLAMVCFGAIALGRFLGKISPRKPMKEVTKVAKRSKVKKGMKAMAATKVTKVTNKKVMKKVAKAMVAKKATKSTTKKAKNRSSINLDEL